MGDALKLPPGATLVDDGATAAPAMKLPPGATLVDPGSAKKPADSDTGVLAGLKRVGSSIIHMPGAIYDAATKPPQNADEEKASTLQGPVGLAMKRLIADPMAAEHAKAQELRAQAATQPDDQANNAYNGTNHLANMHDMASVVPVLGPMAAGIVNRYTGGGGVQQDKSGAVTELAATIAAPKVLEKAASGVVGAGAAVKNAVTPKPALARALPGLSRDSAEAAMPHIQAAANDLGIDPEAATSADVKLAVRQAKQNLMLKAASEAGPDSTLADLPKPRLDELHDNLNALHDVDSALTAAQKVAEANKGKTALTGTDALKKIGTGVVKAGAGTAVGHLIPGGGTIAEVAGLGAGVPDIIKGAKALIRPADVTHDILNTRLQRALLAEPEAAPSGVQPEAIEPRPEWQPLDGDRTVQHTSTIKPPDMAHGDIEVGGPLKPTPWEKLKAGGGQKATTEVLKKTGVTQALKDSGVAAPSATAKPLTEVPGPRLEPSGKFGTSLNGESAALDQLTNYSINELRAIAVQRGLKVEPSNTHLDLIKAIHDDLTPEEVQGFQEYLDNKHLQKSFDQQAAKPPQQADDLEGKLKQSIDNIRNKSGLKVDPNNPGRLIKVKK